MICKKHRIQNCTKCKFKDIAIENTQGLIDKSLLLD